ncbi:SUF system Fe-S cluster assembly regulator [Yunchengibacter salinarum]|uniref:SUF system Fe-S cluster assembly regulator n=1 Tax=Yunchengibacter salinarum TaxID=3133399 RepID=UPI0035B5BF74
MIRLTNLADYGVVLMCEIARLHQAAHQDAVSPERQDALGRVNAQGLSGATGVPVPTVSKILNALGRAGVLVSHRGLKGGFTLARAPEEISIVDVIEAIDGPIALTQCVDHRSGACSLDQVCCMKPHWQTINQAVRSALEGITLSRLAASGPAAPFKAFDAVPAESAQRA